jgi:glycosyltransferase involved in cell wall biosynthesis
MKFLAVLLCYNDGDLLQDSIQYLREQEHDIVLWDHGSTDETPQLVSKMRGELREVRSIPREFDFYELYPAMSRHLIENYTKEYNWISWPDQDEFLEGPGRDRPYREFLREVCESPYDWIQFNNFNYWLTEADNSREPSAPARIRHYSLFPLCAPRIRSWRATSTNIREFNHNPPVGNPLPHRFNLRHYPMRTEEQMRRRLEHDRFGLRRGDKNFHYENMLGWRDRLRLRADQLHFDDGRSELNHSPVFDWSSIYGRPPSASGN